MIRVYRAGEHLQIVTIFTRAIHEIACENYTGEQCLAWSSKTSNPRHWETRCERKQPFVKVIGDVIAGFLELDPDGHIDCAYVNPDFKRQGVMTGLVRHAVARAFNSGHPRVFVEASLCARPLFEKEGFQMIRENSVVLGSSILQNFEMELRNSSISTNI